MTIPAPQPAPQRRHRRLAARAHEQNAARPTAPVRAIQPSLWQTVPATTLHSRPVHYGRRCYLCGSDEPEGYCEECHRPVCFICGGNWRTIMGWEIYSCQVGDTCPAARREQWQRQRHLISGLLDGYTDYPGEILEIFVRKHQLRWQWATADPRNPWCGTQPEDQRDLRRALTRAKRLLARIPPTDDWDEPGPLA